MKNTATLKKISAHLNISISTVSRALKDHPDVAPETKTRVKELAELVDYEPNAFAINLRKSNSNLFAIIVPEISNFFYHSFIKVIEEESRKNGYSVMILQSLDSPELEKENLRLCRHNHVAGIFVAISNKTTNFDVFRKIEEIEIPLVFFDKVPHVEAFNKVCLADYEAGQLSAEKLLAGNKEKVLAIFGNAALSISQRRMQGFMDKCNAINPAIVIETHWAENPGEAKKIVLEYFELAQPPTAIFSMSDEIMCGVLKGLNHLKLNLPTDVSLLTISNGFLPSLFSPEISYVETNGDMLGKLSYTRMQEIISGMKFIRENFLTCSFHAGGSV